MKINLDIQSNFQKHIGTHVHIDIYSQKEIDIYINNKISRKVIRFHICMYKLEVSKNINTHG